MTERPVRADWIYEDKYASLGKAVLFRGPAAFLADADRPHIFNLTKYLPPALSLEEAGRAIE